MTEQPDPQPGDVWRYHVTKSRLHVLGREGNLLVGWLILRSGVVRAAGDSVDSLRSRATLLERPKGTPYVPEPDASDAADAARFRWLAKEGVVWHDLCPMAPRESEWLVGAERARRVIDTVMATEQEKEKSDG